MTPMYLSQSASPFPFVEFKEDGHLQHFTLIPLPHDHQAHPSSSSHSFNLTQDHIGKHYPPQSHQTQLKVNTHGLAGRSNDCHVMSSSSTSPVTNSCGNDGGSGRWMTTKVRLKIGRMVNSATNDHHGKKSTRVVAQEDSEKFISASNDIVRVCSDCNTTKTPLWRSGPRGPKSLCNACGIRQRKARRAMAAGEAVATKNGSNMGVTTTYKVHKKLKKSRSSNVDTEKIRKQENDVLMSCTRFPDHDDKLGKRINKFEEFAISLSKNSAFRRVFPRDEEEAAILLMALSCGLIHG